MPLDYSKWDKLVEEISSDEESNDGNHYNGYRSRVTKFDSPARVTREEDGTISVFEGMSSTAPAPVPAAAKATKLVAAESEAGTDESAKANVYYNKLTRNGGSFTDDRSKANIFWSQDRHEVIVHISIPRTMKPKDIRATGTGIVAYAQRNAAVGDGNWGTLEVMGRLGKEKSKSILLKGDLPHPAYLGEDEEDVDMEIVHTPAWGKIGSKFVRITLRKASPIESVVVWWPSLLKNSPKIDLSTIEGRTKQTDFGKVWEEAHRQFGERQRNLG